MAVPGVGWAQAKRPAAPLPQQTTASFDDWTLRCSRGAAPGQMCEIGQGITNQDRPVAQIALGRVAKGQPMLLTIFVPPNVSFAAAPGLMMAKEGEPPVLELVWRRCLPAGCMANAVVTEDVLRRLRGWAEAGRVVFADGVGRAVVLPFSVKGLGAALDALVKEEG